MPTDDHRLGAPDELVAAVLFRAMKAASPHACIEPVFIGTTSIIDGEFDWADLAQNLQREFHAVGLRVVADSKAEKI